MDQCCESFVWAVKFILQSASTIATVHQEQSAELSHKILTSEALVSESNLSSSPQSQMMRNQGIRRSDQGKTLSTDVSCPDPTRICSSCKSCITILATVLPTRIACACLIVRGSRFASNGKTWQEHNIENAKSSRCWLAISQEIMLASLANVATLSVPSCLHSPMDPNVQMCQTPQADAFALALVAPSKDPTPTFANCQSCAGKLGTSVNNLWSQKWISVDLQLPSISLVYSLHWIDIHRKHLQKLAQLKSNHQHLFVVSSHLNCNWIQFVLIEKTDPPSVPRSVKT